MASSARTALITGGSRGIGRAVALQLAREGFNIAIGYGSDSKAADEVIQQIGPSSSIAIKADASTVVGCEKYVQETVSRFQKIDVVICCAAALPMANLQDTTEAMFNSAFDLNVKGSFFLVQKAVPHMPTNSHSRVILFSTNQCHSTNVTPTYLPYCMTKGAIEQMTRVLNKQLMASGITVNAVCPGPTATEMFFKGKSEELLQALARAHPQGRIGTPGEVADVVSFLAGENSSWVSGQVIRVNGGIA